MEGKEMNRKGLLISMLVLATVCILFWIGVWTNRRLRQRGIAFWTIDVTDLSAFREAEPCVQAVLFIESQSRSDTVVEPFSPYRLPIGAHVFGADPQDIARCALDMGDVLLSYIYARGPLSNPEQREAEVRLLGVIEILCSEDFRHLPPDLEQRRQVLLQRMSEELSSEYRELKMNIQFYCYR